MVPPDEKTPELHLHATMIASVNCTRDDCQQLLDVRAAYYIKIGALQFPFCRRCYTTHPMEKLAAACAAHPERGLT